MILRDVVDLPASGVDTDAPFGPLLLGAQLVPTGTSDPDQGRQPHHRLAGVRPQGRSRHGRPFRPRDLQPAEGHDSICELPGGSIDRVVAGSSIVPFPWRSTSRPVPARLVVNDKVAQKEKVAEVVLIKP